MIYMILFKILFIIFTIITFPIVLLFCAINSRNWKEFVNEISWQMSETIDVIKHKVEK